MTRECVTHFACDCIQAENARLKAELELEKQESEILARFGEWLRIDMSCCYSAEDVAILWKRHIEESRNELARLQAAYEKLREEVNTQAEDAGLWFVSKFDGRNDGPTTIGEAYLQQALRRLHALIEDAAGGEKNHHNCPHYWSEPDNKGMQECSICPAERQRPTGGEEIG